MTFWFLFLSVHSKGMMNPTLMKSLPHYHEACREIFIFFLIVFQGNLTLRPNWRSLNPLKANILPMLLKIMCFSLTHQKNPHIYKYLYSAAVSFVSGNNCIFLVQISTIHSWKLKIITFSAIHNTKQITTSNEQTAFNTDYMPIFLSYNLSVKSIYFLEVIKWLIYFFSSTFFNTSSH